MHKNIRKRIEIIFQRFEKNVSVVTFIIVVHMLLSYLITLPYINLLEELLSAVPLLVDWILILLFFRPSKKIMIYVLSGLCIGGLLLTLAGIKAGTEFVGQGLYIVTVTYVFAMLIDYAKARS